MIYWVFFCSDIFDAMFFVKKEEGEVIIQQGEMTTPPSSRYDDRRSFRNVTYGTLD